MASPPQLDQPLQWLNAALRAAVGLAEVLFGVKPGEDLYRGLSVSEQDVEKLLGRTPGAPLFGSLVDLQGLVAKISADSPLGRVQRRFGLRPFDLAVLLLAVAPEFDQLYERVYAYLQDDVTRRRPSVDLALALFCPDARARDQSRHRFTEFAPLLAHELIELAGDPGPRTGLLGQSIRADDQVLNFLFGTYSLDRRLAAVATSGTPQASLAELPYPLAIRQGLQAIAAAYRDARAGQAAQPWRHGLRLYLHGPDGAGRRQVAEALASDLKGRLLSVDGARLLAHEHSFAQTVRVLLREAEWFSSLLFLDGVDAFQAPERQREWQLLTAALTRSRTAVVLSGTRAVPPPAPQALGLLPLDLPLPDVDARFHFWQAALERRGLPLLPEPEREQLADRYVLTRDQIEDAVAVAVQEARWRAALEGKEHSEATPTFEEYAAAARSQGSYELETLTHRIRPRVRLKELILPADVLAQLEEIVRRIRSRNWVLGEWGFGHKYAYGTGVNALFAGPSGTGKTMAAEGIARSLDKDLYKIDLTAVVSKYIGETEQRLERIFQAGEASQAVLFFDEADSLLGKRSEVRDAHDRYANLEVSFLLQRMERYDGLIVLATNLPGNLDDAFLRRMSAIVHFPTPDAAARQEIWKHVWPERCPRTAELDFRFLAERFDLTGGGIRNAALAAAFTAAERKRARAVYMWDVLKAVRREYQKMGQDLTCEELGFDQFPPPPGEPDPEHPGCEWSGKPVILQPPATALATTGGAHEQEE